MDAIKEFCLLYSNAPIEHCYIIIDDKVEYCLTGDINSIEIPKTIGYRLISTFRQKTFIHNHPLDTTFSIADLTTAYHLQLSEMIAVGPLTYYSIKPKPGYSWPHVTRIKNALSVCSPGEPMDNVIASIADIFNLVYVKKPNKL